MSEVPFYPVGQAEAEKGKGEVMKKYSDMTKAELIAAIKKKFRKASPMVKQIAFHGLEYQKKAELLRRLRKGRVVRGGDISYI